MRPHRTLTFVPVKSEDEQARLCVHRVRQGLVEQRTATINRIRGLLSELDLKAKTAVIVDDATAYGKGVAQEFQKVATSLGIRTLSNGCTTDKAIDFSTLATLVKSKNPDVVFYGGTSAQAGPFAIKLRELGVQAPFLGGDAICTELMATLARTASSIVSCAQGGGDIGSMKGGPEFAKRFRDRFGEAAQQYAVNFYDGVMLVGSAMQKAQSVDAARFTTVVRALAYVGVGGTYSFDADGDQIGAIITVYRFVDAKLVAIGQR